MDNSKDHTGGKEHQAQRDDTHYDQRNGDDLLEENRVLWHVRFIDRTDLICHDLLAFKLLCFGYIVSKLSETTRWVCTGFD